MKIFKIIVAVVLILIAIPLIAALFMEKDYIVEREITINKPANQVFDYVKMMKNQEHYSKWVMADPAMKKDFKGTDGTVGAVYGWNGDDEVGEGEQEITKVTEGERVEMELRFKRPFENTANTYIATEPLAPAVTKVKWAMYGKSTYPMNAMNIMIDGMLGEDMETSLATLKQNLENN